MKKLLILTFIIAMACGDDETSYSDISGGWKFQTNILSGSFNITKSGDKYSVSSYSFVINGKTYSGSASSSVTLNGVSLGNINLNTPDGFVVFSGNTVNSDFTQVKSITQVYAENCLTNTNCPHNTVSSEVTISR